MTIFLARPERIRNGIPLAVKDLFDTAGLRTTYGSILFADHVPARTAEAVARLEAAGYANVGKTNLHEFAYGVSSYNPHFGMVANPFASDRMAGGSSSGWGAAVAVGLADAALGSDSGGSIRIPAACCGIVGFKSTHGLVPLETCFPLASGFDHAGPMARDVETCARMLEALAPSLRPTALGSLEEFAVGIAWLDHAEERVRGRVEAAAALFPHRRDVAFPFPERVDAVFKREVAESHDGLFPEFADSHGANVRTKLERCVAVTDAQFESGLRAREVYRERAAEAIEGLDGLVGQRLDARPAHDLNGAPASVGPPGNCATAPAGAVEVEARLDPGLGALLPERDRIVVAGDVRCRSVREVERRDQAGRIRLRRTPRRARSSTSSATSHNVTLAISPPPTS